jgi:hypothetical protein
VDHWTSVGQSLASRGFSVIACERVAEEQDRDDKDEGKNLILAVLEALRWNRAILVGCDREAALAIQAALELAPERIGGLVLCGDLSMAEDFVKQSSTDRHSPLATDEYLQTTLACPYTIVYDGDWHSRHKLSASMDLSKNRCMIIGGGSAPHRRQPEQFAWSLTRFVEEKVAPIALKYASKPKPPDDAKSRLSLPFHLGEIFSPGSFLVAGRTIARFVIYGSLLKVAIYQYDNFHGGMVAIQSHYRLILSSPKKVLAAISSPRKFFAAISGFFLSLFRSSAEESGDVDGSNEVSSGKQHTLAHNDSLPFDENESSLEMSDVPGPEDDRPREFPPGLMFLDQIYV